MPHAPRQNAQRPAAPRTASAAPAPVTRRDFVCAGSCALVAAALAACGGGDGPTSGRPPGTTPPGPPTPTAGAGITFAGGTLTVPLSAVPSLAGANGFLITNGGANNVRDAAGRAADLIVINVGTDAFRAFSSICTHEACTVSSFASGRILCACHGSEYDATGRNVAGPAPRPLAEFPTTFDAATRTITVRRG